MASSLQFTNCIKSAVHKLHQACSSQLSSSLQFTTCIKPAVHNLQQVCWQLATDLILSSRSKRCERILISAWWSQVASGLQQTCCNLRVSGCVYTAHSPLQSATLLSWHSHYLRYLFVPILLRFTLYFVYKVYIGFFNITYMHDWIVTVAQYIQYISFLKYSIFENMAV